MLEVEDHGAVRTLRLARPPVNALDPALVAALTAAVRAAPAAGVRGLLLTGSAGRFCAGLDVKVLLGLDRAGIAAFWTLFFDCGRALATSPLPIVVAINGHSPAGGAVLALYCDHRVMAEGDYRIGLNEVQVGIHPGPVIHRVLARVVGERHAAACLATGALLSSAQAHAIGFVDELAPLADVEARARAWLGHVLALPSGAYAATRALVRADLVALIEQLDAAQVEQMTALWFSAGTQASLRALFPAPVAT